MVTTLKRTNRKYYCMNCRMVQNELKPYCAFCGYEFSNYEKVLTEDMANTFINNITSSLPPKEIRGYRAHMEILDDAPMIEAPDIIVGGRWWEKQEPEEELTDRQKELLDKLYVAVKKLRDSIFEEE